MSHVSSSGLKILRVWGFNDVRSDPGPGTVYFQLFQGSSATINTGANGLQRLDSVVRAAEKYSVKLIIPFVNNWKDYGGMSAYFSACGVFTNFQWYQSSRCQAMYQNYVRAVISRYRTSTAIFAWELANEPRCTLCLTSVLTNWIRQSSDFIRSLDSDHMIAIGDEGFGLSGDISIPYGPWEGWDWKTNVALPNISFGTFHLYTSAWGVSNQWGNGWVQNHAKICKELGKPCLFEEYGVNSGDKCSVTGQWQGTSLGLREQGMAGDTFWQLGDTIPSSGENTHNDGYTVYYGSANWTCMVEDHVRNIG